MSTTYPGIYRGKVLGTDLLETNKLGRLKIEVYPMLLSSDVNGSVAQLRAEGFTNIEGITLEALPWAVPAMSLFSGAGDGFGSFTLPEVGSYVWVFFENSDVYQPVYFAEAQTKTYGVPSEALTGYPCRKVWKTKNGMVVEINDTLTEETFKITHPAGTTITIGSTGDVTVSAIGPVNISGSTVNLNP